MGVRVNALAAGPTESGALTGMMGLTEGQAKPVKHQERAQVSIGRRGFPDEVARWIVSFAISGNEWVTGQVLGVDGGLGLI
jgi:NAD(P)-dependent dehydrogenase (short-subunit alcohol dehydrogenase family)